MADISENIGGLAVLKTRSTRGRHSHGVGRWFVLALLILFTLVILFPFVLAAMNAIKSAKDYTANGPLALPRSFDLSAIVTFWNDVDFTRKLINSILISGATAVIAVTISLLNAFAIGIGRIKGGNKILMVLLLAITLPQESLIYPVYFLAKWTGLFNTPYSLIIVVSILHTAFGTYLLSTVLTAFPRELLDAARIDGATPWQILWYVVVPVLRPTLAVLATFFFIWTWNEFLLPLVLLVTNDYQTVSVALGVLRGQYTSNPTATAAASLLGMAPTIIFFLIFQRTLSRGVVVGAIK